MAIRKSQWGQSMRAAVTCVLVLGMLSMIWPAIMTVSMGVFLLLHSWSAGEEFVVLSWPQGW